MKKVSNYGLTALAAVVSLTSTSAFAQVIDGTLDASYGSPDAVVQTNPLAPTSNFGAPTSQSTAGYNFYVNGGATFASFFVQQTGGDSAGPFSNLYFDLDRGTRSGSDLGFEISAGGVRAFIPENGTAVAIDSSLFSVASSMNGQFTNLEFRLANSLFNSAIAGLTYNPAVTFTGDNRVNLSQSISYSVAGGQAFYGDNRLGTFSTAAVSGAVPEPATWAMMLMGFGAVGFAMRRRAKVRTTVSYA